MSCGKGILRSWQLLLVLLLAIGVFLFFWRCYPQLLSYHEQNQLFLWAWGYLLGELSLAGGLSVWLGEFLVQFYYVGWLGALVLALVYIALQQGVWAYMRPYVRRYVWLWYASSFIPCLLLLLMMGDYNLLLSWPVSVILSLWLAVAMRRHSWWWDIIIVPVAYWLVGSTIILYVVLRLFRRGGRQLWRPLWLVPYLLLFMLLTARTVMAQWSTTAVITGVGYYRIPLPYHGHTIGYNKDVYALLMDDYLVRHERWDDIIRRSERYQPHTAFSCVCTNLALAKKRQLAARMFDFYQSGRDALVMGIFRDNTSDLPSMEVFWHLAMINECLRYAFDLQEAILNARRSGRLTKRLAECYLINGRYDVARKHLALLEQSLFYRRWARTTKQLLLSEDAINSHPVYGEKRRRRFSSDFLYNYNEIDKVFGRLFVTNPRNTLALDYFMAQMLLRGSIHAFMQHMSWVEQYGGYSAIPRGYGDALRYIQSQGHAPDTAYGRYVDFMRRTGRLKE